MDNSAIAGLVGQAYQGNEGDSTSKLQKANDLKAEGNEFFKKKAYKDALFRYNQVFLYLRGLQTYTDEQKEQVKQLTIGTSNNMAACYIIEKKWEKVIVKTDAVLKLDPENNKAIYRRGKAWNEIGDLDKAKADIVRAYKKNPKSKPIREEYAKLRKKLQNHKAKQQKAYSKMLQTIESSEGGLYPDRKVKEKSADEIPEEIRKNLPPGANPVVQEAKIVEEVPVPMEVTEPEEFG
mmetsp:Transcript_11027/g.12123  ORF Transcript_11027/g.12123 Transcript_11027/m.12123 type:complete len:236 (-) Transcript_11027:48-755(-)